MTMTHTLPRSDSLRPPGILARLARLGGIFGGRGGTLSDPAPRPSGDIKRDPSGGIAQPRGAQLPDGLTARQAEVLSMLAAGLTNREIAGRLVISQRTVDHHIAAIYDKIGVHRRAEAVCYAMRHGLTAPTAAA